MENMRILKMKYFFLGLIFVAFFLIIIFYLYALLDHHYTTLESQIGSNEKRIEVLEIPPQVGGDEEKIKLATQLAEANTKLINTDFDKLKLELKESNQQWLWGLAGFIGMIVAIVVAITGVALWFVVKSLIADSVEKSLNGFKKAVEKVNILEDQFRVLRIDHAASLLEGFISGVLIDLERQPERIKVLPDDVLLEVFSDKTRDLAIRFTAIEVLAARKSALLVSPVLIFLNSIVDTEIDWGASSDASRYPFLFLDRLRRIRNEETYQGLKTFLNRLIKDNPKNKNIFLPWAVFPLVDVGLKLDKGDSVDMLRKVIHDLKDLEQNSTMLKILIEYFDKFQEPDGIKDILTNGLTDNLPDVEEKCLELLQSRYPDFVKEWKDKRKTIT